MLYLIGSLSGCLFFCYFVMLFLWYSLCLDGDDVYCWCLLICHAKKDLNVGNGIQTFMSYQGSISAAMEITRVFLLESYCSLNGCIQHFSILRNGTYNTLFFPWNIFLHNFWFDATYKQLCSAMPFSSLLLWTFKNDVSRPGKVGYNTTRHKNEWTRSDYYYVDIIRHGW